MSGLFTIEVMRRGGRTGRKCRWLILRREICGKGHRNEADLSPVNLSAFGLDNGLGHEGGAEVFWPVADPSGLITATVTRK